MDLDKAAAGQLIIALMEFVRDYPERVTPELQTAYEAFKEAMTPDETDTCIHCGRKIERKGDRWTHRRGDRSCHAASFDVEEGSWDDSLDRRLIASPSKK